MKAILILFISLISLQLTAQKHYEDVTITFGDLKLEKSKKVLLISAFKIDEGYLIFKKEPIKGPGGWRYFIETFDDNLKSLKTTDVSQQFEDENYIIKEITRVGNSYVLFSIKNFKSESKDVLYIQTFNWDTGKLSSPNKLHSQIYEGKRNRLQFVSRTSTNNRFLMYEVYIIKKGEPVKTNYTVFDENLEEVWSIDKVSFDEEDGRHYEEKSALIGNNGRIYILGSRQILRDRKAGVKQSKKEYEIALVSEEGIEITKINAKSHKLDDVSMTQTKDKTIFFGGYYLGEDVSGIEGVFLFTLDNELEVNDEIWSEFSHEFITQGWSNRQTKKAKKKEDKGTLGLNNLYLRRVVKHDDGSVSMVGEIYWITVTTTTNANGGTSTKTTYHYGDLIITRISAEGEVLNQTKISKHHTYSGAYEYFSVKNDLIVVMLKRKLSLANIAKEDLTKAIKKKYEGYTFAMTKINEEGKVETSMLLDYMDEKYKSFRRYKTVRRNCEIIENDKSIELIVLTYKGKKQFALGKFTFEKK